MARAATAAGSPRFALVPAVYNAAPYLPDFIRSVEEQDYPLDRVEVVAVNDGSTDESLAILEEWRARRPDLVTVLSKPNGGQGSARNLGARHVRAEWTGFPDPDDLLATDYLRHVAEFLDRHSATQMVATRRIMFDDVTGRRRPHVLDKHFQPRDQLRDISKHAAYFHGSSPSAFFRTEVLRRTGLEHDDRVRPTFEDGHFCCRYLLSLLSPQLGFVRTAEYYYRKRFDRSSTLDRALQDPGRYTAVPRHGYLALLRESAERYGRPPEWLQSFVLYELGWLFAAEEAMSGAQTAAVGAVADEFHEIMAEISALLDPHVVESYALHRFRNEWREILVHGYRPQAWHTPFVKADTLDARQAAVRVSYRFTGERPSEQILVNGTVVDPEHQKVRSMRYFDRPMLHQRIAWVPLGSLRVELDGEVADIRTTEPERPVHTLTGWQAQYRLNTRFAEKADAADTERPSVRAVRAYLTVKATRRLARTRPVRRVFGRAWVLMDRIHDADDSAEHLFRHLRKRKRGINAWFVIEAGTTDHARLRTDGYRRLVPYGSLRWKLLMLNCEHLISSHADEPIVRPPALSRLAPHPEWRFTFLQHGVMKDDLSAWLNWKRIDVFVTSTPGEYRSVVADGTGYRYTTRETRLTGLPRFDALREADGRFPPDRRDLVLIAPTWRNWLVPSLAEGSQRRTLNVEEFMESDFARNWWSVLGDPELAAVARGAGLTVGLLLHPNLEPVLPHVDLPEHVQAFTFEGTDVRDLFARSRVLVTDYSSMAFNAAYIDRPTVFFQFDRDLVLGGAHVGRRGYFDYERDGFGPVTFTPGDAVGAIVAAVAHGPDPLPEYRARIEATFPQRDGSCCERVVEAIQTSTRRLKAAEPAADTAEAPSPDTGEDEGGGADAAADTPTENGAPQGAPDDPEDRSATVVVDAPTGAVHDPRRNAPDGTRAEGAGGR